HDPRRLVARQRLADDRARRPGLAVVRRTEEQNLAAQLARVLLIEDDERDVDATIGAGSDARLVDEEARVLCQQGLGPVEVNVLPRRRVVAIGEARHETGAAAPGSER